MSLKELSQLYWLKKEIDRDNKRLAELRGKAYQAGSVGFTDGGGGSDAGSRVERYGTLIADLENVIYEKIRKSIAEQRKLELYIMGIPDSFLRQIFTYRFVEGRSWVQVAMNIGGNNTADGVRMACNRYIHSRKRK